MTISLISPRWPIVGCPRPGQPVDPALVNEKPKASLERAGQGAASSYVTAAAQIAADPFSDEVRQAGI
jgi:hypothetical protein